ncbi:MAG: hypothetical protein K2Q18_07995 [Bdellovibrionales bacterium]|nr:hypothetical protein [Bdellovibrionales bacterium]
MNKNKKLNSLSVSLLLTLLVSFSGTTLITSCSTGDFNQVPREREIANNDIDKLIEEFRNFYDNNLSAARKEDIKTVQENLLKYLLEATNSNEAYKIKIYKEANNYLNKVYPAVMNNLRNEKNGVNEFVEIKKAPIWTLKEEIRFLNMEAEKLPVGKVKVDFARGLSVFSKLYKSLVIDDEMKAKADVKYKAAVQNLMGEKFDLYPSLKELELLIEANISDEKRVVRLVDLVESKLKVHENQIRNIGTTIASSGQVDLKNPQVKIVVKFMDYYFNHLPDDVIKTIMSECVNAKVKLTQEEVIKIVFSNTGPGLGKLLQQIGKEPGIGDSLTKMMEVLESEGKEVPLYLVKEAVAMDKGGYEIKSVDKKLGTGTIAQVNKASMWVDNQEKEVALRLRKPGVDIRCKEDIKVLRQFVPDNEAMFAAEGINDIKMLSTLIDSVERFLNEELDFGIAVERQKKAYDIYNRSLKITTSNDKYNLLELKVPEVYFPPKGKSNLHVQEFAGGGVKFAALTDGDTKKIVAREMVRMWFEETLFKSGFFNADLHQGNFRITLIEEDNKIKVVLYDFGLSTTLTKDEQRAFMLVGAGAYLKSPSTLADGLMASMNSKDQAFRTKLKNEIQAEMKLNPNKRPEDWVVWCVQKNYFVSENLGAFARGSLLIKQLPESIGETEMFKDTILKAAFSNLKHAVADRDYSYPLTKIDMIKVGGIQIKNFCSDLIKKFFK